MVAIATTSLALAQGEHPRPDFERTDWINLNGLWEFQFDPDNRGLEERWYALEKPYALRIRVPFGWESKLSGVERKDYKGAAWYRREFTVPEKWDRKRIWLCFGAVDHKAEVWVNDQPVGAHEGGYSEFRFDITPRVRFGRPNRLTVRVEDHTDPETPLGKQIPSWYTSTSGIWQTVWLEATGAATVQAVRIVPEANAQGVPTGTMRFRLTISVIDPREPLIVEIRSRNRQFPTVQRALTEIGTPTLEASLTVSVPKPQFWTPESPTLYPYEVRVLASNRKQVHDSVCGYFGIRTVRWGPYNNSPCSYVLLNGKPVYLRAVLDQSFNPDGIYTAPDDEFLKRDIQLAKQAGFNMLRIHIKADEPRKLYWADRLGIMVQADIPCFFQPSERARQLFEKTLRDQIERDFNHPSIVIWTVFNEEWGIGQIHNTPREHRVDWVLRMVSLTRELDPTRLVQDNTGWAHLETDLNSFHWYGRNVDVLRQMYQAVNRVDVGLGKTWNYIVERASRGEPFVNNEFSYLAAFDGDGDWSWGNLFAVNALRSLDKLVGYCYTELTDVEWEHNGAYNYDRSPKEFGYDFWAKGMSVRDVFAEDFLVLDMPAIKHAQLGEAVQVPILFSHYSGRWVEKPLRLYYKLDCIDTQGRRRWGKAHSLLIQDGAPAYRLTGLTVAEIALPDEPCLATFVAWIEDPQENRIHINYTQWAVGLEHIAPVVKEGRRWLLRFDPNQYVRSEFSELNAPPIPIKDKHYGRGHGFVEYRIPLPEELDLTRLKRLTLRMEVSAKAGREKVDWAQRIHLDDYPQTDGKKFPSRVLVEIAGKRVGVWELPDDPADARGVLSHWAGVERGSYGYLMEASLTVDPIVQAEFAKERAVSVRLIVSPELAGGIAIYGATMGCYPMPPTLIAEF